MHAAISAKVCYFVEVFSPTVVGLARGYHFKNQEARKKALEQEIEQLQARLGEGVDAEKIVKRHIALLHKYNEAKDAAQILIGRLASIKQTTIRQIHEDYGLTDDD
ncbi:hypothetical protein D9613_002680 [Agrocybe pediades]|uniref:Swi5-domain-containing protein n=1 Tax=Agrocybe pediades TaxID=84607 RepID=A0A8H4VLN3_9AGAR|nr:hypothetical protein D9613_002680 [Agrocybe pediades]KAF9564417.1 Swi5-domain-containing protein [Agrocybe pediades]